MAFISKHVVFPMFCSPAFVLLGPFISFLFHFVGQQLLFDWPNGFPPSVDKTLSHYTSTNLGPSKGKVSLQIKAGFSGIQLALPHYESIISRSLFLRFLPHFSFLCGVADPVLVTFFINRDTVDWFTSKRLAISFCESSACFHKLRIYALFLGIVSDIVEDKDTKIPLVTTNVLQCQKTLYEDY